MGRSWERPPLDPPLEERKEKRELEVAMARAQSPGRRCTPEGKSHTQGSCNEMIVLELESDRERKEKGKGKTTGEERGRGEEQGGKGDKEYDCGWVCWVWIGHTFCCCVDKTGPEELSQKVRVQNALKAKSIWKRRRAEAGKGRDFWCLSKSPEPLKVMKAGMKLREDLTLLCEQMEHVSSRTTAPNDEQTMRMLSDPADNSSPRGQAMVSVSEAYRGRFPSWAQAENRET